MCTLVAIIIVLTSITLNNINFDKTEIIPIADSSLNEEIREALSKNVDIYDDNTIAANSIDDESKEIVDKNDSNIENNENKTTDKVYTEDKIIKEDITLTVVGELMMGADVTENLNYSYSDAFKNIYRFTRNADFTYGILGTNITNVEKISNVKSKYLVTKEIKSAFITLGIDALNIATDHITDYDKTIFVTTLDTLKSNNIYMTGIKDSTLYVDIYGKKVAIISALSSYIGDKIKYEEFGINLYDEARMDRDIKDAKDNADFVIVDVSWGRDTNFGVTSQMNRIARLAIDSGADLVLGSNALGIYPIEIYNNVPIIYSTGYLITDSDLTLAQRSYIWQFNINKDNKVSYLNMIPVCSENKTITNDFRISNPEMSKEYNELINNWNIENKVNSKVNEDGTITVKF